MTATSTDVAPADDGLGRFSNAILSGTRSREIVSRVERGLITRVRNGARIFAQDVPPTHVEQTRPSVSAALLSRTDDSALPPPYGGDERWIFIAAALTAPNLEQQRRLTASIVDPQDAAFVSNYAMGALLGGEHMTFEAATLLDDSDFSIVFESLAIGGLLPEHVEHQCLALVDQHIRNPLNKRGFEDGFSQLRQRLLGLAPGTVSLAVYQRTLQTLKQEYLPVFGPDIFSVLQVLVEPGNGLSSVQLDRMHALMRRWGLLELFGQLMLLRLPGPYNAERAFIAKNSTTLFAPMLGQRQAEMLRAVLAGHHQSIPPRPRSASFTDVFVQLVARLEAARALGDTSVAMEAIIDLYVLDPTVMGFLPWDGISRALRNVTTRDARTAFLTLLMTDETVKARYPRVSIRLGKGAFVADLMGMVDINRRGDPIAAVLTQVRSLPAPAAESLTRAILDKPIIERVASSLPTPKRWMGELPPIDRARLSVIRIDALRVAGDRSLLPPGEVARHLSREVEDLRFQLLQGQLMSGRVKLAWNEVGKALDAFFRENLPISALQLSLTPGQASGTISGLPARLADYIAQQVVAFVIDGSEHSLNQALSSNLRHGVILPRFLRAFDDALQSVWPDQPLLNWDEPSVVQRLGEHGKLILALREGVSDQIKTYMDYWLTIHPEGTVAQALRIRIRDRILTHFAAGPTVRLQVLRRGIVSEVRMALTRFLREASRALNESVRRGIVAELKQVRKAIKSGGPPEPRWFGDSLETNLHNALEEVRRWCKPVSASGYAPPFKLAEVVNLHLLSAALGARDRLKVRTTVLLNGKPAAEWRIDGRYLGFFQEVVRNLLSNAFKGSGDGLKTQAELRLSVDPDRMVIRCENVINSTRVSEVIAAFPNTVAQAQRENPSQAAKDHKSGFQKIRLACRQTFKVQPRINIPPIARRSPRFIIDIIIPPPLGGLFVEQQR